MHCTWTPTGATEVGIDGYIELFDPGTQHPLGKSLGVQSKVNAALSNERDDSFDYYCSERDLQYWLRGNLPVLLSSSLVQRMRKRTGCRSRTTSTHRKRLPQKGPFLKIRAAL